MRIYLVAVFPEQFLRKAVFLVLKNLIFHNWKCGRAFYNFWACCSWTDCISGGHLWGLVFNKKSSSLSSYATLFYSASTEHWFLKNSLHTFRNSRLWSCTEHLVHHRKEQSFITYCPTDLYFCPWSLGSFNLDRIHTDHWDCAFDYKKCSLPLYGCSSLRQLLLQCKAVFQKWRFLASFLLISMQISWVQ